MFEKSLYELIRGLRNHRGNERAYIQGSLKECRTEIKSQNMDVKATALLKLIYLEMFGHDMSWASFHVLEVMSSPKFLLKRVGYLGAQQSFGPNTDVLMLATNLLQKDLTSPLPTTISLPLMIIPHVGTPSLALSLLADLLPRLTHSHPTIRKKTIVTLYRLALVYPETLRPAWPKIKERLLDEKEELTVTVAIVNVVCELAWRRPQDFLPLAPRLFSLLVDAGNNWMAIKIVKLFALLTPLEPRLVRKLLPPLTLLIKTTPAMSLLYECVNGIIQGGILRSSEGTLEGEEIAALCVGKLRGMILTESDRNLRYVALLAFDQIVVSHPHLVSEHQDVIMDCLDDADISIRLRALKLVVSMVDVDHLIPAVDRLLRQLRTSPVARAEDDQVIEPQPVEPAADFDDEDTEEILRRGGSGSPQPLSLPEDYRVDVIQQILDMCSQSTYTNVIDFDWYLGVLVQLVRLAPTGAASESGLVSSGMTSGERHQEPNISEKIGLELLNVAVRVKDVRVSATRAAETLIVAEKSPGCNWAVLSSAAWMVGEYGEHLAHPSDTLTALLQCLSLKVSADILASCLQAIPKVFTFLTCDEDVPWNAKRKTMISLLIARILHSLEPLSVHAALEVQERSVELLELMRLIAESVSGHSMTDVDGRATSAPLILTRVVPSMFSGTELNPVARGAQKKVPLPDDLDLERPINEELDSLLLDFDLDAIDDEEDHEFHRFYHERVATRPSPTPESAVNRVQALPPTAATSTGAEDAETQGSAIIAKRLADRRERNQDDPFYIGSDRAPVTGSSTPIHNILRDTDGDVLDVDAIPMMKLELNSVLHRDRLTTANESEPQPPSRRKKKKKVIITGDETLATLDDPTPESTSDTTSSRNGTLRPNPKAAKSILQVDSSGLGKFSFTADADSDSANQQGLERRRQEEEQEMARALKEVERARLEMQRAADRIQAAAGVPPEGTLVVKKKKKKKKIGRKVITEIDTRSADDNGNENKNTNKEAMPDLPMDITEGDPASSNPTKKLKVQA